MTDEKKATGVDKLRESVQDVSDLFKIVNLPDPPAGVDNAGAETESQKK